MAETRQDAWRWMVKKFDQPHFAYCGSSLRPTDIDTELVGHFASIGFVPGHRFYVFEGQANRDRFLNQYRPHKPQPCKDPCP